MLHTDITYNIIFFEHVHLMVILFFFFSFYVFQVDVEFFVVVLDGDFLFSSFLRPLPFDVPLMACKYCSIQVPAIEKPLMVTQSPTISFRSFTACSSPLMSTESIVQKKLYIVIVCNRRYNRFSPSTVYTVFHRASLKCDKQLLTCYQLDLLKQQKCGIINFKESTSIH